MTDIDLIKSKADIVAIVSEYVELQKAGANYKGLCPFHGEKTPSFMVNPNLQIFKCFGCGKGGDAITFIQEIEKLEFGDTLRYLAEKLGVELSSQNIHKNEALEKEKKELYKANLAAANFYHYILTTHKAGEKARKYIQKRKLTRNEIGKFCFGYAPMSFDNLKNYLLKKGFNEKKLTDWGLLVERNGRYIDKFRERLLQPIYDSKGNVVGFSGRYIGDNPNAPKYLNSSETPVYKKNELLYSLYHSKDDIRKSKYVILVEGNIDVVSSHRVGEPSIVAPLGTAFTSDQARLIKRYAETLYFCFDNDSAGLNALIRSLGYVEDLGINHKVIDLGKYKDCDDLICQDPELWTKSVANPVDTMDYIIKKLTTGLNFEKVDAKTKFYAFIIPILKTIKNEVYKSHYIKKIAIMLEVEESVIIEALKANTLKIIPKMLDEPKVEKVKIKVPTTKREMYLLAILIQHPENLNLNEYSNLFIDERIQVLIDSLAAKKAVEDFTEELKEIYELASLYDLSDIEDWKLELEKLKTTMYKEYLKKEIRKLKKEITLDPDNEEIISRLGELIRELARL